MNIIKKENIKKTIYREDMKIYPNNMIIELTNYCNHRCIFCANRKMARKRGYINKEFACRILKEAYSLGTSRVGFYATGEPLMCKELPIYIKEAKEIGYKYIYLTTNGALLTDDKMKEIVEAGLNSIKFSVNAGTNKTYNLIHGKDDFDSVIKNIIKFDKYRKKSNLNIKIYISFIKTKQNNDEYKLLIETLNEYVDAIVCNDVYNQGGNMYEINSHIILDDKYKPIKLPCNMIFNRFHITYDGYLNACCVDFDNYLAVADLKKVSLEEAWNCKEMRELRHRHIINDLSGTACYNCINNANEDVKPLVKEYATKHKNNLEEDIDIIRRRLNHFNEK
ncbi:radical SAM/SPASM domain-containing protein [Clostridiaceae bacterium M8S5]|nr:radical SAM/SPASM domain-containing protein [Clostridiaceae bacterium M8S5]